MAFSVTVITAQPYWLRYVISYDGAGPQSLVIPNAQLVADLSAVTTAHSPLLEVLRPPYTFPEFLSNLVPVIRAHANPLVAAFGGGPPDVWGIAVAPNPNLIDLFVEKVGAASGGLQFDLWYVNSLIR